MKHFVTGVAISALMLAGASPASARVQTTADDVDVAFVLDTTGSMSGLIEGAKQKIWSIASAIAEIRQARQDQGNQGHIRFALIGFRDRGDAYVTKTFDLSDDLDSIYGHLLSFRAQGGGDRPESVNQALYEAVNDLHWRRNRHTARLVFLVGDSPPHMDYRGDTPYAVSLRTARQHGITVNTVQAGRLPDTTRYWREIADLGDGEYLTIAQNGGMVQTPTPYDDQIEQMQRAINETVLSYGTKAERAAVHGKQSLALAAAAPVASDRASYRLKAGKRNKIITGGHELVEDYEDGKIAVGSLPQEALPKAMQGLSKEEQKQKLDTLVAKRQKLNQDMAGLVKNRDAFLRQEAAKRAASASADAFDVQVRQTIARQMTGKPKETK